MQMAYIVRAELPGPDSMKTYMGALDQGTTSTRFKIFDGAARIAAVGQKEHTQIFPQPGWVEHDPEEILNRTCEVIAEAMECDAHIPLSSRIGGSAR